MPSVSGLGLCNGPRYDRVSRLGDWDGHPRVRVLTFECGPVGDFRGVGHVDLDGCYPTRWVRAAAAALAVEGVVATPDGGDSAHGVVGATLGAEDRHG